MDRPARLGPLQAPGPSQHLGVGYPVNSAVPNTGKMKALAPVKQTVGTAIN